MSATARAVRVPRAGVWASLAAALLLLVGCYLPSEYNADLRITPDGRYNFRYEGFLTSGYMLQRMAEKASPAELAEKAGVVERDLRRDQNFSEVTYVGNGTYRVKYERHGNIDEQGSFTFVRLNSRIFTIQRGDDGVIKMFGAKPDAKTVKAVEDAGLKTKGIVRVQTEARVTDHNAHQVIPGEKPIYIWNLDNLRMPSPRLEFPIRRP
ncbi:MAG: hypothetical protein AB7G39_07665 [Alphaproteobacteria bacterium]